MLQSCQCYEHAQRAQRFALRAQLRRIPQPQLRGLPTMQGARVEQAQVLRGNAVELPQCVVLGDGTLQSHILPSELVQQAGGHVQHALHGVDGACGPRLLHARQLQIPARNEACRGRQKNEPCVDSLELHATLRGVHGVVGQLLEQPLGQGDAQQAAAQA